MDAPATTAPTVEEAKQLKQVPTQSEEVLTKLRAALPSTSIEAAWPSRVPGLYGVRLSNGQVAYTDVNARFFILGVIFDLGNGQALDGALDGQTKTD